MPTTAAGLRTPGGGVSFRGRWNRRHRASSRSDIPSRADSNADELRMLFPLILIKQEHNQRPSPGYLGHIRRLDTGQEQHMNAIAKRILILLTAIAALGILRI